MDTIENFMVEGFQFSFNIGWWWSILSITYNRKRMNALSEHDLNMTQSEAKSNVPSCGKFFNFIFTFTSSSILPPESHSRSELSSCRIFSISSRPNIRFRFHLLPLTCEEWYFWYFVLCFKLAFHHYFANICSCVWLLLLYLTPFHTSVLSILFIVVLVSCTYLENSKSTKGNVLTIFISGSDVFLILWDNVNDLSMAYAKFPKDKKLWKYLVLSRQLTLNMSENQTLFNYLETFVLSRPPKML